MIPERTLDPGRHVSDPRLRLESAVTRVLAEAPSAEASPSLLRAICESLGWRIGILWKIDREEHVLRCAEIWNDPENAVHAFAERSRRLTFASGVGLPGRVWATGEPAWIPDVTKDSNFPRLPAAAAAGLRAGVGFPIRLAGQVLGVMEFFSEELRGPDEHLLRSMAVIGSEVGQLMERLDVETLVRLREARYEAIVASALDCVIGMDHEGRITEFNPAAERTFGLARSEAIGRLLGETIVPADLRADHARGLAHYLETGDSHILDRRLELTGLRADGEEFPVELTVTRIDGDGRQPSRGSSVTSPIA